MRTDATKQKFAELGAVAVSLGPQDFAAYIASETQRWSRVVEAANIRLE
jgi:tripartite-type tricarboxylate transporter receptor subunit TctC